MAEIRDRLRAALETIEEFGRGQFELRLRPPATEARIQEVEAEFGWRLPEDLRELYLLHDGQDQLTATARLFLDEPFATLTRATNVWRDLGSFYGVRHGVPPAPSDFPSDSPELRPVEHDIAWFPFAVLDDETKQAYWVDMNPVEGRPVGQVIEEGPWAHPPQFLGDSVLALLELVAHHIRLGDMTTAPQFGFLTWGFGPRQATFPWARQALAAADGAYPSFIEDLPPDWSAYLRTKSPLYSVLLQASAQLRSPSALRDQMIPESSLAAVDMEARPLRSADALGDVTSLRRIVLRNARSLQGLDAVKLGTLVLIDSPQVSYRDVQLAPYSFELRGDVAIPDVDQSAVKILRVPLSRDLWTIIDRFPALTQLEVVLDPDADPNDYLWERNAELTSLTIRGGTISSLDFLAPLVVLQHVRILEPVSLALSGLPVGRGLGMSFVGATMPADLDRLSHLEVPDRLAGPIEWFRALEGQMAPGVWTTVFDGGSSSEWPDLSARNWAERRATLSSRGLEGF